MDPTTTFRPTARTKARRRTKRVFHDEAAVFAVLDTAMLAHIGYVIDGQPFVTPTVFWRDGRTLYWHGSAASRMLRSCHDAPVCLTVSHLDGLVFDRSGFHHSANYRSVMAFGRARLIKDNAAKRVALDAMIQRLYPGHVASLRPATLAELKQTAFVTMEIEEASVKTRSGGPSAALDIDVGWNGWRGEIPVETRIATPRPDPDNGDHRGLPPELCHLGPGCRLDRALAMAAGVASDIADSNDVPDQPIPN